HIERGQQQHGDGAGQEHFEQREAAAGSGSGDHGVVPPVVVVGLAIGAAVPICCGSKTICVSATSNLRPLKACESVTVTVYRFGKPAGVLSTVQLQAGSSSQVPEPPLAR